MSRFADPKASARLVLAGGCQCPGEPHDEDWIEIRTELGTSDVLVISEGNSVDALERLAVSWNLLDDDGSPAPVDRAHIERLYVDAFDQFDDWIEKNVKVKALPNGSGARSRNGSRPSALPARGTRTRG